MIDYYTLCSYTYTTELYLDIRYRANYRAQIATNQESFASNCTSESVAVA